MLTLLAVSTLFLCFTFLIWQVGLVGIAGHTLGICAHFAAIIMTGVFRYGEQGAKCAENESEIRYGEDGAATFKFSDHGHTIEGIFISMCVLFCFYNCFTVFMMRVSKILMQARKEMK